MLYRGVGATFSPYVPGVDSALSAGLKRAGMAGNRKKAVFTAVTLEQALDYSGDSGECFQVSPKEGAIVSWVEGCADLVLLFQDYIRDRYHRNTHQQSRLLSDVAGDASILEVYIQRGRCKKTITRTVDQFISQLTPREIVFSDHDHLMKTLNGHDGEVWITGKVDMTPYHIPRNDIPAMTM